MSPIAHCSEVKSGVLDKLSSTLYSLDGIRAEKLVGQFINPPPNLNFELNGRGVFFVSNQCNLNCIYCKGLPSSVYPPGLVEFEKLVGSWRNRKLKYIHLTGLEPTVSPCIHDYFKVAEKYDLEVSMSTNGYQDFNLYRRLLENGLRHISISLDAHNEHLTQLMGRKRGIFSLVSRNIQKLNDLKSIYPIKIAICLAVTHKNFYSLPEIVSHFIVNLQPDDIRLIPVAQETFTLKDRAYYSEHLQPALLQMASTRYPFLSYRIDNFFNIRGVTDDYSDKCYIVLDERTVGGGYLYPCNIYIRERGEPITTLDDPEQNQKVWQWFNHHNSKEDRICRKNCCDVTREYNQLIDKHLYALEENGCFQPDSMLASIIREKAIEQLTAQLSLKQINPLYQHLKRTALTAGIIGKALGWHFITIYYLMRAAFLHDIGKAHPSLVYLNSKSRFNTSDRSLLKKHTFYGQDMVYRIGYYTEGEIALLHHERVDGSGWNKIKLDWPVAELAGLADAYSALTEDREHRNRYSPYEAVSLIENHECGAFRVEYLNTLRYCLENDLLC